MISGSCARDVDRFSMLRHRGVVGLSTLIAFCFLSPVSLPADDAPAKAALQADGVKKQDAVKKVETKVETKKVDETYSTRLFLTESDGSNPKQLLDLPGYISQGSPEWSVDGKLICFDAWESGGSVATGKIVVVNSDGTKPRIIADGVMPSFSPRGNRIAFSSSNKGGVWVVSTEGPDTELVQLEANAWGVSWAPDGRLVYKLSTGRRANLCVMNIVEGTKEFLFDEVTSPYQSIQWNMSWSPDSKRIAFKGITMDGKTEVGIVDARGEEHGLVHFPLADGHESLSWTADGTRILVTKPCPERANTRQIYSFDPNKQDSLQLLSKQEPDRPSTTAAQSPDGKKLVVSFQMPVPAKTPAATPAAK